MVIEDRDIIARALAGEPERFESLVRKYTRLGGAIAFGILGDYQLAEDVLQDAFFKAFRSLPSLKEPGKFKVWFSGIVRSTALDERRKRRVRSDVKPEQVTRPRVSESEAPDSTPLEAQVQEEARVKVLETIRQLSEEDRMVIILKYMEGLSYKEVAEIVGSTVSAVESRLFRARQILKSKLVRAM